jgi:hypothetical protein
VKWWEAELSAGRRQAQLEDEAGIKHQQVSRWRYCLADCEAYREHLLGAEYKAAALMEPDGTNVRGTQGTGDNEWFTPPEFIELARTENKTVAIHTGV